MINFVVCDDVINITEKTANMLEAIFIKNNFNASVVLKATNYETVINYVKSNKVDVLILDINLKASLSRVRFSRGN